MIKRLHITVYDFIFEREVKDINIILTLYSIDAFEIHVLCV